MDKTTLLVPCALNVAVPEPMKQAILSMKPALNREHIKDNSSP